ncbi:MAG: hypothetical protein QMB14_04720 [Polaromonas sp.]|jgi:hypothetical protein
MNPSKRLVAPLLIASTTLMGLPIMAHAGLVTLVLILSGCATPQVS